MGKHAVLAPSSASRWLACTPSARLESKFEDRAGEAAKEGTFAHGFAELIIQRNLKIISLPKFKAEMLEVVKNKYYSKDTEDYLETYAAEVCEAFYEAQAVSVDAQIILEEIVHFEEYVPEGFGSTDVTIIYDGVLHVIDLKYGKGVPVDAHENKQAMLYALGSYLKYHWQYDIKTVRMSIKQPRLNNNTTYEMQAGDLAAWAEMELRPLAELAFKGEGKFKPGPYCQFCKAKGSCRALSEVNLDILKYDFKQSDLLEPAEVSDILQKTKIITEWLKAVNDYAFAEALNGVKWPGMKLVEGRSNRVYADTKVVVEELQKAGVKDDRIFEPSTLLGITALEKSIGKTEFARIVSPYLVKPPGKPTLVPETDKRPEFKDAKADFDMFEAFVD